MPLPPPPGAVQLNEAEPPPGHIWQFGPSEGALSTVATDGPGKIPGFIDPTTDMSVNGPGEDATDLPTSGMARTVPSRPAVSMSRL